MRKKGFIGAIVLGIIIFGTIILALLILLSSEEGNQELLFALLFLLM